MPALLNRHFAKILPPGDWMTISLQLAKIRISIAVTASAAMGFLVAGAKPALPLLTASVGTFLLAVGAAAFNHWQEKDSDAQMARTRNRPLPAGKVRPEVVAIGAGIFGIGGALTLFFAGITAFCLGLIALGWYNGIYTPLKKITAWAAVPGAVIGAIPPVIGWSAAGASPGDPKIISIALFFFFWQIPHFWLLALYHRQDYEQGALPTLTQRLTPRQLALASFVLIIAAVTTCLLMVIGAMIAHWWLAAVLTAISTLVIAGSLPLLRQPPALISVRRHFHQINIYALAVMVLLTVDAWLSWYL